MPKERRTTPSMFAPILRLVNITAFSHTKVPRLSLVAASAAAARRAILVDVAKDPQQIDPLIEEQALRQKVEDLKFSPQYLMVVGDPGSLPFISTGLIQKLSDDHGVRGLQGLSIAHK